jgi:hypothetical protein
MALSHHEPRALERIAVDLSAEDPWLASTLAHDGWNATRWPQRLSAAVLFVVGMPTLASAIFVPHSIPGGIFAVSILGRVADSTLAYWLRRSGHGPTLIENAPQLWTGGYLIDLGRRV